VFAFVFGSKRWRVNFGLDSKRTPKTKLAVPYRAKDLPTARSEFSHPDVVLSLTSICYYYGGLDNEDIAAALTHLIDSDQAQVEYREWVRHAAELPTSLTHVSGINLSDKECQQKLYPALKFSKGAVDYFLSYLVFPKEMKEFPDKISASSWDIASTMKVHPTTGFSGTKDTSDLLPHSVKHLDLPRQRHTGALVLEYLLGNENTVELLPSTKPSQTSDTVQLLQYVVDMKPQIRVILDVGASILELTNIEVAKEWLKISSHDEIEAVVFVNDDDELSVLDRTSKVEILQTSPFASRLDVCLVYLDEAHTRGIDLKLPNYRAAVTLGANLTKDRLVQACMRMRKLGKGQSVVS
jgi:hypothetical protein